MNSSILILSLFIILNLILIITFKKNKFFHMIMDKPDGVRKFHISPTPLAGGIIIFINLILYSTIFIFDKNFFPQEIFFKNDKIFFSFIFSLTSIFILGIIDDKINLNPTLKFLILLLIIFFLLKYDESLILKNIEISFFSNQINIGKYGFFFSLFCFLVFLNAFNMFDGINLQSSLYSIIIFVNILYYSETSILICLFLISIISFSFLNFKNLTFLGDNGTLIIGFSISYFFIKLYNLKNITFADEIVLYMLIPGLDLIRLFIIRIINKKNPLKPDRLHLHHLLLEKYSYKKTLIILLALLSAPIILNYLGINLFMIILSTVLIYFSTVIKISKKS